MYLFFKKLIRQGIITSSSRTIVTYAGCLPTHVMTKSGCKEVAFLKNGSNVTNISKIIDTNNSSLI